MASLYKRGKVWWIKYRDRYGRVVQKSCRTEDRADAIQYQVEVEDALVRCAPAPQRIEIMDAAKRWVSQIKGRRLSPHTEENYFAALNRFLEWWGESFPSSTTLNEVTVPRLYEYRDSIGHLSPSSIRLEWRSLGVFLNWCVKMEWIEDNPLTKVDLPRSPKRRVHCWSPAEVRVILDNAPPETSALYEFLYRTASRIGETLELKVGDVDLDNGTVRMKAENTKAYRDDDVIVSVKLLPVLQSLCDGKEESEHVFERKGHVKQDKNRYHKKLKRLLASLGLEGSHHTFKHSAVSHWLQAGVPLKVVQRLARHRSIQTTLLYSHLIPSSLDGAVDRLPV